MSQLGDESPLRLAAGPVDVGEWSRAAAAVLRRMSRTVDDPARAWQALATSTVEGVTIPPLGTADRAAGRVLRVDLPAPSEHGWDVRARVFDSDPAAAAAAALVELESGATSLWLSVGGPGVPPGDLAAALREVRLDRVPVVVEPTGGVSASAAAAAFIDVLRAARVAPAGGTNLGADPIGRAARAAGPPAAGHPTAPDIADDISDIVSMATDLGVRGFVVDGTAAHAGGAGEVAELGYVLAAGVQYLRMLEVSGLAIDAALRLLELRLAVTDEQFPSIAKLRAARVLWRRIGELSGATDPESAMRVHAVTSLPMTTRYDPWVNLLRTTVAAFAAGVGGADAVTVQPFDVRLGVPDSFGRRMARNISALLIEESHVAAVGDPSAGAYAVEMLTTDLAEAAWACFQAIERGGGVLSALADGSLTGGWGRTAQQRRWQIATRRRPITGVSEFPDPMQILPGRTAWPGDPAPGTIFWAEDFEQMRDEPTVGVVFLATLGPISEHSGRAGFVTNVLAAGGVPIRSAGPTQTVEDVIAAHRGDQVAVVAGTDAAYAEWGADVITALRVAGARTIVLAGRPAPELAGLIDDHVAAGQDVVEFLHRIRAKLAGEEVLG